MVKIFEDDGFSVIRFKARFAEGRTFEIFAEVFDGGFAVVGLFVEMDNPGFLIEHVKPGIEGGIGFDVPETSREDEAAGLEFGAEEIDNGITPHEFQSVMMEISAFNPGIMIKSQAAGSGGKVNMEVAFEIAAESVGGKEDTGNEVILGGELFNDAGGDRRDFIEEMAIEPEEGLKFKRQSPGDLLPGGIGERVKSGFNPVVSGFFAAGGTETGFAGMRGVEAAKAFWTDKHMPAEKRSSAGKHFKHIKNNGFANQFSMAKKEPPPVAVIDEDIPDFDMTTDEFHRGTIVNLNVGER